MQKAAGRSLHNAAPVRLASNKSRRFLRRYEAFFHPLLHSPITVLMPHVRGEKNEVVCRRTCLDFVGGWVAELNFLKNAEGEEGDVLDLTAGWREAEPYRVTDGR